MSESIVFHRDQVIDFILKCFLISLLSVPASHGGFPVLESLPSFLVLDRVFQVSVGSVLVEDGILQILFLFICQFVEVNVRGNISLIKRAVFILLSDLFNLVGKSDAGGRVGGFLSFLGVALSSA